VSKETKLTKEIDFDAVRTRVLEQLEKNLSPKFYYHGLHHTRDDVLPAAERLAKIANVGEDEVLLLRTAALYHDIGYLEHYLDHESIGARIATAELPNLGYTPEQVQKIADLIIATRMPHNPRTNLQKLICDADLDSLGREDFFIASHSLRLELKEMGIVTTLKEWYVRQLKFLESHQYLTEAAQNLRNDGKKRNIMELRDILGMPIQPPSRTMRETKVKAVSELNKS
jgi:uncharacterized protein